MDGLTCEPAEFEYRVPWRATARHPGAHRGGVPGDGYEFRGHAPLVAANDPRRLDLHASLKDPFGQMLVRVHQQPSQAALCIVADLSGSMGFEGHGSRLSIVADFVDSAARSTRRRGDPFAFVGCDAAVRQELLLPATRRWQRGLAIAERLRRLRTEARGADALPTAALWLPRRRSLVFLVSDFLMPLESVSRILAALARHHLVPVVLRDTVEIEGAARWGIGWLADLESGKRRTVLWRPGLRRRVRRAALSRRQALLRLFAEAGCAPLFMTDAFQPNDVTRYFHGTTSLAEM